MLIYIADAEYAGFGTLLVDPTKKTRHIIKRVAYTASETGLTINIPLNKETFNQREQFYIHQWIDIPQRINS